MKIFDAHCDTISKLYENGDTLLQNTHHVDLKRMLQYDEFIQVFAICVDKDEIKTTPYNHVMRHIAYYESELSKYSDIITHIDSIQDKRQNRISSILAIEGGEALMGDIYNLKRFYNRGVRIITLTWNHANEIAVGALGGSGGVTDFGREVIALMNELNMVIDVSHLNDESFWDVMELTDKPVIASHSNARSVCRFEQSPMRSLSDDQIRAIIQIGGCIGINLCPEFLSGTKTADVNDIIQHINKFLELGAEQSLGLGCDFDGINETPESINGVGNLNILFDAMSKHGYSDDLIENIAYNNFLRVLS